MDAAAEEHGLKEEVSMETSGLSVHAAQMYGDAQQTCMDGTNLRIDAAQQYALEASEQMHAGYKEAKDNYNKLPQQRRYRVLAVATFSGLCIVVGITLAAALGGQSDRHTSAVAARAHRSHPARAPVTSASLCAPTSWATIGGTWGFEGGCSVGNKEKAQGEVLTLLEDEYRWSDVDVSVTISAASGGGAGLLFRAHNYSYGGINAKDGYDNNGGHQYYAYLNFANQVVTLGRFHGTWTKLDKADLPALDLDTPYRLRVVAVDCAIAVFVDEELYITAEDCSIPEGTVGLKTFGAMATFSDLNVDVAR